MQTNIISLLFPVYEKEFYRYMIPWVVEKLRNATYKRFKRKYDVRDLFIDKHDAYIDTGKIDKETKNIIVNAVEDYFKYVYPESLSPDNYNITKNRRLEKIQEYLKENNL